MLQFGSDLLNGEHNDCIRFKVPYNYSQSGFNSSSYRGFILYSKVYRWNEQKMTWNLKGIPYKTSDTQAGFSEVPFGFGSAPKASKRSRRRMIWEDENDEGGDDVDEDSDEV